MYSFDLKSKLRQLNSLLFINDEARRHVHGDFYASSLCLQKGKRSKESTAGEYARLDDSARKFLQDYDKGLMPEFVCGVPLEFIPEHDLFHVETRYNRLFKETQIMSSRFLARGWRSVCLILAKKRLIDLDKARRVFACPGLGVDDYDKRSHDEKVRWAAGLRFKEPR